MSRRLLLSIPAILATLVVVLAITALRGSGHSTPRSSAARGLFLTASTMPAGLGGRTAPRFHLADTRGGTLASSSLRGRPYAITFLYTHCPDVCPLIGDEIHAALSQLGASAARIAVVGISVDPRGDTAGAVRAWLQLHHEPANFHYLVGSQTSLASVWKGYFAAPQIPGDPQSSHTASIWLVDRRGRLAALIDAGVALNVGNLAHDFRVLIDKA